LTPGPEELKKLFSLTGSQGLSRDMRSEQRVSPRSRARRPQEPFSVTERELELLLPGFLKGSFPIPDRLDAMEITREVSILSGRSICVSLSDVLFLDCETTGLTVAAGTYVFLVGLAAVRGRRLWIKQFLLDDMTREKELLDAALREMARFPLLASFNGKSYDMPLLETRCAMARIPFPLEGKDHLDILYPARALWRRRLRDCKLK
jgi:uncharacterized protein YprB with RNaseH-like and TPR domain